MILDEIVERTKEDLIKRKQAMPENILGQAAAINCFYPRDVVKALRKTDETRLNIIAEVKRASPSKGTIRDHFDPLAIALSYEKGSAAAISILTEPHWFKGDIEYVSMIRRHCSLPLLRKDFIIDRYQILEAYTYGADFILLIARILSSAALKELLEIARSVGMEALVEIHDKSDLTKAITAGALIIGINHRDLDTLEINERLCDQLIPLIPQGKIIVAESGLHSHEQLVNLSKMGVDAFLIGEHFMRQDNIENALRSMLGK